MVTRRSFLRSTGAFAPASAATGAGRPALAGSPNALRILCWEGYDSDAVLDPFRRSFDAEVHAQRLESDPEAIDLLRAARPGAWDLINVNNPWARKVMWPEGLIRALPRERFEPYYERMLPRFRPPFAWAMDETGEHLLGMAQRFGPFSFVVNIDRISRDLAEDQGFKLFLDPAMKGRFGVLTYDNWNINHLCVAADIDPFKPKRPDDIDAFAAVARRVFSGAAMLSDDMTRLNKALIGGDIDAYFTGGTYTASAARFAGARNLRGITPRSGPIRGKGGIVWIELTSVVANPGSPRLAEAFLSYVQRPDVSKKVAFAAGTYNPVSQMGDAKVLAAFDRRELDALQWDTLGAELARCADFDINPDYGVMHPIYAAARRGHGHKAPN